MNLQGRELKIEMSGNDVRLLQQELRLLGLEISDAELEPAFFGKITRRAVISFQGSVGLKPTGVVDEGTAKAINARVDEIDGDGDGSGVDFVVRGHVWTEGGRPLAGVRVSAFDRDLRSAEQLGASETGVDGTYEIHYTRSSFVRTEKDLADLLVRGDLPGHGAPVESDIVFNAPQESTVDLVMDGVEPSEFERLQALLIPLCGDIHVAELTEDVERDDISFLAGETGIDQIWIAFFVVAHRYEGRTDVPAAAFYGWFREGLPTPLPLLGKQPVIELAVALRAAVRASVIPTDLDQLAETLADRLVKGGVASVTDSEPDDPPGSFGALLAVGLEDPADRRLFLELYLANTGSIESFWAGIPERLAFTEDRVERLQLTMQLGALTQNHAPLVRRLSEMLDDGALGSLRDLATFDQEHWESLITAAGGAPSGLGGQDDEEATKRYAVTLGRMVEDAFPTAVIAHRGQSDPALAGALAPRFLASNPDFDVRTSNVDAFIADRPDDATDQEALRLELKAIQRVFKIAPRYEPLRALIADDIHSAFAVTRMSRNAFVQKYRGAMGAGQAKIVYENASQAHAFALNLIAEYAPGINGVSLRTLAPTAASSIAAPVSAELASASGVSSLASGPVGIPDWETLFGSIDFCECEHCRSVYSPAAYLVDTLHFLKDRPSNTAGVSAKDVLLGRRPDLGDIELTCDNTNIVLPFVDLVNEILEADIAPFVPFSLPPTAAADLDSGNISAEIQGAFAAANQDLVPDAQVVIGTPAAMWTITDHTQRYSVQASAGGAPQVVGVAYQTSGTPADLAAAPQHVNPGAYDALREGVFPWALPFDLWLEETRAYLDHLGVPRHRLMEVFRQASSTSTDLEIAAEELGLTANERRLYAGEPLIPARTASEFFGFAASAPAGWIDDAGQLRSLMSATHLTADQVAELMRMRFVNPTGAVTIESTDPTDPFTCDTAKLAVRNHDAGTLDRIHRFLRLQRHLGWTMRELDRVLVVLNPTAIDADVIQALAGLRRLGAVLNLSVRDLLVFYAPIDTFAYDEPEHGDRPPYDQWFLNPAVIKLNPGEPGPFALTPDRTELAIEGDLTDRDVAAALLGALNVSEDELGALISGPLAVVTSGKKLQRDNLSRLIRVVFLARGLGIDAGDLPRLIALRGIAPFAAADTDALGAGPPTPATIRKTLEFVEVAGTFAASGFSIPDLAAILGGRPAPASTVSPTDAAIASTLDGLRTGLRAIFDATAGYLDDKGDYTRKQLALLNWDMTLIDEVMGALLGTTTYETPLASLPSNAVFTDIGARTTYDEAAHRLRFTGRMSASQQSMLLALSNDPPYVAAVNALATASSSAATDDEGFEAPLVALPLGVTFDSLASLIAYDIEAKQLRFAGAMTANQQLMLRALSGSAAYRAAVDRLSAAPRATVTGKMRAFTLPVFGAALTALPSDLVFARPLKSKIFFDIGAQELKFTGYMTSAEHGSLQALSNDAPYLVAVEALFNAQPGPAPSASDVFLTGANSTELFDTAQSVATRLEFVLKRLQPHLRRTLSEAFAKQRLGEAVGLEPAAAEALLGRWLRSPSQPSPALALTDLLAPAYAATDPAVMLTRAAFPAQFQAVALLSSVAAILSRLRISTPQFEWVFADTAASGWLDLNSLPVAPAADPSPLFAPFVRLLELCRLRDDLRGGEDVLANVFSLARSGATADVILAAIGDRTTWSPSDLTFLADPARFDLTAPADFADERGLIRLTNAFRLLRRLGVAADRAVAWTKPEPTEADAHGVRQAVKAKYETADWLGLAGPLRDTLRERQRAALVAYLLVRPDAARNQHWSDSSGLYQHFLIDIEMDPCQLTSRIKQALSSIQLFVQRCLLNLEGDVAANATVDSRWREWPWMRSYRVWEANRKVFLYPENWVEPGLRLDKSQFFNQVEDRLLQQDITTQTAEDAFLSYLDKLDEVANLEVQGVYHLIEKNESGNVAVDEYHVFGRTRGTPHIYYHRKRVDKLFWTAWEKLDLDIEGDNLIPVFWNRRLYLFWTVFTIHGKEGGGTVPPPGQVVEEPAKYWTIQLAWSEFKRNQWQAKKTSRESLKTSGTSISPEAYAFKARVDEANGDLLVLCLHNWFPSGALGYFRIGGHGAILAYDLETAPRTFSTLVPKRTWLMNMAFIEQESNPGPLYLTTGNAPPGATWDQLEDQTTQVAVLDRTPGHNPFRIVPLHQHEQFTSQDGFLFEDGDRTFFVEPHDVRSLIDWATPQMSRPMLDHHVYRSYRLSPWWADGTERLETREFDDPVFDPLLQSAHTAILDEAARSIVALAPVGPLKFQGTGADDGWATNGPAFAKDSLVAAPAHAIGTMSLHGATKEPLSRQAKDILAGAKKSGVYTDTWAIQRETHYRFAPFHHPFVGLFTKELNRNGLDALLQRAIQIAPDALLDPIPPSASMPAPFDFAATYAPNAALVDTPYPIDDVDFDELGSYSIYNWELFFHLPLLIATRLSQNQRFEEAHHWFNTIYDPTDTSPHPAPKRYWRTRPFHERADATYQQERIEKLLDLVARGSADPAVQAQVKQWREHPFEPHIVARLRTTAYQKSVVMKYLDNLIAWADSLFGRDTIESINEAAQLYVLAAESLGAAPVRMVPRARPVIHTYRELEPSLDAFSNALVTAEDFAPSNGNSSAVTTASLPPVSLPALLYFCIPPNDKLLRYWDIVGDRLFKVRHCQNIEGLTRQLALFEPPIDPGALVRAVAAGLDIGSVLNDVNAPLPPYRFATMIVKATELTAEVKALGGALLAALEKRDAETLALLRSSHEITLLDAARQVRVQQIDEAKRGREGLQKQRELVGIRQTYYRTREYISAGEAVQLAMMANAIELQTAAAVLDVAASVVHLIPNVKIAFPSSGPTFGGENLGDALKGFAGSLGLIAGTLNASGSMASTLAGYARRADDWQLQADIAAKEIEQLDKQIAGAEVRIAITERELENHDLQVANAREVDEFMRDKFTNRDLYDWMVGQISGTYFQSYQLAYDVAKRAEQNYRYELGLADSGFVQFGYWDSLRKGLLAGERLHHDLKRMELSYHEENRREYELTKRVSLVMLDPRALYSLKKTGECFVSLPESIWDLDAPGHYMRRLKTVSVTIPSVTGPYAGVNLTLTMVRSAVRVENRLLAGKYVRQESDPRFREIGGGVQAIMTSTGQDDAGLFEINLRDERYLPFEGAGAISEWHLRLSEKFRQFDYDTIADVVLHVRYTAREGGPALRDQVRTEMQEAINLLPHGDSQRGLFRMFSARQDFSTEWAHFLHPDPGEDQEFTVAIGKDRFPFLFHDKKIHVDKAQLVLQLKAGPRTVARGTFVDAYAAAAPLKVTLAPPTGSKSDELTSTPDVFGGMPTATVDVDVTIEGPAPWTVTAARDDVAAVASSIRTESGILDPDIVQDIAVILHYKLE